MKKVIIIQGFLLVIISNLFSQVSVGQWRDHLSFYNSSEILLTTEKMYCIANNNLYYYDKKNGEVNKLNKVTGLSDINVTCIAYDEELKILIAGYDNGNIDIIDDEGVFNISAIKRKNFALKFINKIRISDHTAYLSTGFGILTVNLEKKEIKDTYFIGYNAAKLNVIDVAFDNNYIYALLENEILRADRNSGFLIDFNQWQSIYKKSPQNKFKDLISFNGKIFITVSVGGNFNDSLFTFENSHLFNRNIKSDLDYFSLKAKDNGLMVSTSEGPYLINENFEILNQYDFPYYTTINDIDYDNSFYIGTLDAGVIKYNTNGYLDYIIPVGPRNYGAYSFGNSNGVMWVAGESPSRKGSDFGVHIFENEKWGNINSYYDPKLASMRNMNRIAIDPNNPEHVFIGSYGWGIAELKNRQVTNVYDATNSILEPVEGLGPEYVNVAGLGFDSHGNLLFCLDQNNKPLHVLTPEHELIYIKTSFNFSRNVQVKDVLVTSKDQLWLAMPQNGILVYDINGTPDDLSDDLEKKVSVTNQDGKALNLVYCLAEDNDGNIWAGTEEGPVIYYNTEDIFEPGNPVGNQIKLPEEDGLVQYLLVSDRINSIAIDGADRKWFGTEKSGVYLFSADGYHQIHNFTEENSPLLSNNIDNIGINDKTGEVFFATGKGLIAYREAATKNGDDFGKVYTFPNPVRGDYEGKIVITGLADNVNVKITDISGNLVYETTALGGSAVWEGRNHDGKKVHTGVYLVFCTNEDGSKTYVTKLVFIN